MLFVRDITDEREREVRRLQAEKLASIGMLAAGVAHEINNPAAFVLANIEALTGHLRLIEEKVRELPDAGRPAPRPAGACCSRRRPSCRSRRRGWRASTASCATWVVLARRRRRRRRRINVNAAVESALTMLRNELKYRARVERDLRAT